VCLYKIDLHRREVPSTYSSDLHVRVGLS
jgi:hypothetical protein